MQETFQEKCHEQKNELCYDGYHKGVIVSILYA